LYELIWNKFVASQMSPAVIDQTSVTLEASGHFFRANGSIIKFPGFRTVYLESALEKQSRKGGDDEEDDAKSSSLELPEITQNESLKPLQNPDSLEHWTSPPPRYNEASIVKDMEEKGIGRPSTYASIISNIQDKHYVEKIENRFMPTELGIVVCKMLIQSFPSIMDVNFTASIEEQLDLIEEGELNWKKVLKEFWTDFEVTLVKAQDEMKNLKKQEIPTGIKCLKCTDGMYMIKWGRNGQFFACSNYPDCNSTQDFDKDLSGKLTIRPKKYFRNICPTCSSRMEEKSGKFGRFIRCEEYPKCDTTKPYTIDVTCPKCKVGQFAEKKSRYGKIFYGCSNYPECQTAMWDEPKVYPCPKCGHALMGVKFSKRDGHFLACPECKHRVDIKETPFAKEYIKEETVN
jgi:DNA topoisomerase-1